MANDILVDGVIELWLPVLPVAVPLLFAGICLSLGSRQGLLAYSAALGALAYTVSVILLAERVFTGGGIGVTMSNWPAPFGISFYVDALGALFVSATVPIFVGGLWWGYENITGSKLHHFVAAAFALIAGVCGAFLTGDIFNLYVWFEVLLISTFALMAQAGNFQRFEGLWKYAILNLIATTFFLVSVGLLYAQFGTLNFADLSNMRSEISGTPVGLKGVGAIMMLALAMKAAAFPLFVWLPSSYHVPLPAVSAICAAILSKVGAYAIIRTNTLLNTYNFDLLAVLATCTLVIGTLGVLGHSSIRRMAGFLVIISTGVVLLGLSVGGTSALGGAIGYAIQSMFVLFAMYLIGGLVERWQQSPDESVVEGGGKSYFNRAPILSSVFLIAGLSAAGIPPLPSFIPKIIILEAAFVDERWLMGTVLLIASFATLVAVGRIWSLTFLRAPTCVNTRQTSDDQAENVPDLSGVSGISDGNAPQTFLIKMREQIILILCGVLILLLGVFSGFWQPLADAAANQASEATHYIETFTEVSQ